MSPRSRDRHVLREAAPDVGLALLMLVAGLAMTRWFPDVNGISWRGPQATPDRLVGTVVLVVACAGEALRRVRPLAGVVLVATAVLGGALWVGTTDVVVLLVLADLLYCAVLHSGRRTGRAVAAVGLIGAGTVALGVLLDGSGPVVVPSLINLVLVVVIPVAWAAEVRRHRDVAEAERIRADQAARMVELDRAAAVAAERARMARDLHDVVAGRLSAIALQAEAALQPGVDPDTGKQVLGAVRESGVAALGEMRTLIGLLRDGDPADPPGAPPRLGELEPLLRTARAAGLTVELADGRAPVPAADLPVAVELAGYRILQEALTNAAKHAPGSRVVVDITTSEKELVLRVGNGPAAGRRKSLPGTSAGTGLDGLAERARAVGGSCVAGPDAAGGWAVRAVLPLQVVPEEERTVGR
ncbi:two-component sensor histidine kinase [Pseudonocardia sp. EV170527-09]|uniref:sensor histidine kinase n=1 Tax=Pseudonocardia sp. EV170527-09 TaxID=2603411 RepID=UPI0011F0E431|nr:histidine kinase [Pseudonocardia sp. EV170527-09]KAA1028948.1 two-component sensor histidine kinase [Pseudonocardia sp. EV170527-09]